MAYIPSSGSVVAFQSDPSQLQASITGTVTLRNLPSVSGQVGASIIGTAPVKLESSNASVISIIPSSIAVAIISGSVAAVANQSVSGTVGASIVGQLPAGTAPLGSIATLQGTNPWNIAGSVAALQVGTWQVSIAGIPSISGTVQLANGGQGLGYGPDNADDVVTVSVNSELKSLARNTVFNGGTWDRWRGNSSIGALVSTGASSVITIPQMSSMLAVPVGSTVAVLQAPSIVGTYTEDAASATGDKGIFVLGVRNDTMASITSADGDYSGMVQGPAGETIVSNSPITKWVYGTTSIVSGPSVALIAAQGASIFTYVTGFQVVNPSANNLTGILSTGAGAASVLLYWTAPANGGSNMVFPNPLRSRDNTAILASISGIGSVYLSAQGFIAKT